MSTTELTAATSWRVTRGIYRFHPELRRALLQTPVDEIAPEVFLHLPEWCPYIDLDGGEPFGRHRMGGFYAHLDWMPGAPAAPVLRLVVAVERAESPQMVWLPYYLGLQHRTLGEAWSEVRPDVREVDPAFKVAAEDEWAQAMRIGLPLLLYLASQEPDVRHRREPERRPERRRPERDTGGPNWWEVGYRVGSVLGRARASEPDATAGSGGEGRSPAPHIRRAHYHLYWTGRGRQEPRLRWLHPILVGDLDGHELPATIRRVEASARPDRGGAELPDATRQVEDQEATSR